MRERTALQLWGTGSVPVSFLAAGDFTAVG